MEIANKGNVLMYNVNYHYSVDDTPKEIIVKQVGTHSEAVEFILMQYDSVVEGSAVDENFAEGRDAEICKDIVLNNYSIENV